VTGLDDLDLVADLNAEDDDGFGWSTLANAVTPDRVCPGRCRSPAITRPRRSYE
jgi:hypothetical protein